MFEREKIMKLVRPDQMDKKNLEKLSPTNRVVVDPQFLALSKSHFVIIAVSIESVTELKGAPRSHPRLLDSRGSRELVWRLRASFSSIKDHAKGSPIFHLLRTHTCVFKRSILPSEFAESINHPPTTISRQEFP